MMTPPIKDPMAIFWFPKSPQANPPTMMPRRRISQAKPLRFPANVLKAVAASVVFGKPALISAKTSGVQKKKRRARRVKSDQRKESVIEQNMIAPYLVNAGTGKFFYFFPPPRDDVAPNRFACSTASKKRPRRLAFGN